LIFRTVVVAVLLKEKNQDIRPIVFQNTKKHFEIYPESFVLI